MLATVPFAPDLAVEVNSPDDRPRDVAEKVRAWLTAGSRLVWVVDPLSRTTTVDQTGEMSRCLADYEELRGDDVVPGFVLRVGEVFN